MEAIVLNKNTRQESHRFVNFESFIFTERYLDDGDFQIKTNDVESAIKAIPPGSFLCCSKSDTVMISNNYSISSKGGENSLTIKGNTLDSVFRHRPALPTIAASTYLNAEYPDGWEFGDKEEVSVNNYLDPIDIARQVLQKTIVENYGRGEELKHVKLPVIIDTQIVNNKRSIPFDKFPYFSISRDSNVRDVLMDLMFRGNFGMTIKRPPYGPSVINESDTSSFRANFYRPMIIDRGVLISEHVGDYYAYDSSISFSDVPNYIFHITEDYVESVRALDAEGFNARIKVAEDKIVDLPPFEFENIPKQRLIKDPVKSYENALSVSVDMEGDVIGYKVESYFNSLGLERRPLFLGDVVGLDVPALNALYKTDQLQVQVVEYIRSVDANGYREYPSFKYFHNPKDENSSIVKEKDIVRHNNWV